MKRILIAAAVLIAATSVVPSGAKARTISTKTVTFAATTPCAIACSYWVNPNDPALAATMHIDYVVSVFEDDRGFDKQTSYACTDPGPAGSYRDLVLTAPRYADHIKVVAKPTVDWDIVLCHKPARGNNGRFIEFGHPEGPLDFDQPDEYCTHGCTDTLIAKVTAGRRYVLRAFSWSDPHALRARIYWQDW